SGDRAQDAVLVQELCEPLYEVPLRHIFERYPAGVAGITCCGGLLAIQHGHREVENHEVPVGLEALGYADQRAANSFEPGLFGEFSHDRLNQQLAMFDAAAGHRPHASVRIGISLYQQELAVENYYRAHA